MRAAYITQPGPADQIIVGEVPVPKPGSHDVLVKVSHSAINPIDLYIRSGMVAASLPNPFILQADFAGTVQEVGAEVKQVKPGDRVWGSNQGMMGRQGTAAEFASIHEDWVYPLPAGVNPADAASVALTSITAHLGLFRTAELKVNETVFVHGGTGGVGSMVVQMAVATGAKVITTVGSEAKAKLCREWGAALVVNYKTEDWAARIKEYTQGQGVDVWFETQRDPNLEQILPLIKQRGRMVVIAGRAAKPTLPFGSFYTRDLSIRGMAMFNASASEQRNCANDINRWLSNKQLKAHIGRSFPLAQTADAHRLLEQNTMQQAGTLSGKIVVEIN